MGRIYWRREGLEGASVGEVQPIRNMLAILVLIVAVAAGCARPQTWWTKPSVDMARFRFDDYECTEEANQTLWASVTLHVKVRRLDEHLYKQCMMARGYSETAPPSGK